MAIVNFYESPMSNVTEQKEVREKLSVKDIIQEHLSSINEFVEEYEVYNIETGKTEIRKEVISDVKSIIVVNGKEESLDYIIQGKDIINIVFVPQSRQVGAGIATIVLGVAAIIASAVMGPAVIAGTLTAITKGGLAVMAIGGLVGVASGIVMLLGAGKEKEKSSSKQADTEAALTIKGVENPLILGQRYPFIFGKTALNPPVVGSSYHETFVAPDGKFESQYITSLYCLGYGPLKVTDFKIGETILFYNHSRDIDGEKDYKTCMHGKIIPYVKANEFEQEVANNKEYYTYDENTNTFKKPNSQPTEANFVADTYYKLTHRIPKKWKNNDVSIEILQRGLAKKDSEYSLNGGSLYDKTIIEDQVDANLIYIYDNDIYEAADKNYKGVAIPIGYRTNTVRLSQGCPFRIEVELDFKAGVYRTRSETSGNASKQVYYDIPVRYAVQWRPIKDNAPTSDAENKDDGDWRTFDYIKLGNTKEGWQEPQEYTLGDALTDLTLNAGLSPKTIQRYKDAMTRYANEVIAKNYLPIAYQQALSDAEARRPYGSYNYYKDGEMEQIAAYNAQKIATQYAKDWIQVNDYEKMKAVGDAGYVTETGYNEHWVGEKVFCINEGRDYAKKIKPDDMDANERLYVFAKDFTADEAREILDSGYDKVEVRVIRLTPCYIDQNGVDSEKYGDFSYQDLASWSTMRTFCFDKEKYQEAIKTNHDALPSDYPLRPIKEEDLNKFVYVAIRLKQDAAEVGGSTLKRLRMNVESFSPKWSENDKKWYPENIETRHKFYQKVFNDNKWTLVELTEEQYVNKILAGEEHLSKQIVGNNFVEQVASEVFSDEARIDETEEYNLLTKCEEKYIDSNAACSVMLGLVGSQNGKYAKTYDDINLESATELYNFCKDVTDGTPDDTSPDKLLHIKYSCNGVISEEKKIEDTIVSFLLTARSVLTRDEYNRYSFLIAKPANYPVAILNNQNVLMKSNTRLFTENPSGLQTTFPDEKDDYTTNPLYIMDKGESWKNPSKPMEPFTIPYVTNEKQLWSLGCYNLATRLFQREVYTRTVGKIGLAFSLGDLVLLQDDSLLVGTDNGARIKEVIEFDGIIYGFVTDELYEYFGEVDENGDCTQGVSIVQPDKYGASRIVTLRLAGPEGNDKIPRESFPVGITNIVALAHPITVTEDGNYSEESLVENGEFCTLNPKEGDLVAFGLITNITQEALITAIKPNNGKFSLSLIPYNKEFYNYGKAIPAFTPKMTIPRRTDSDIVFSEYAKKSDIASSQSFGETSQNDPVLDLNTETVITRCEATKDGVILESETFFIDEFGEKQRITPLEITWKVIRQDVLSEYVLAEEQPTEDTDFTKNKYFFKNPITKEFEQATNYSSAYSYYTQNVSVIDTPVTQFVSKEENFLYMFERNKSISEFGGYPEYYDLYPFQITASAKVTVSSKTSDSMFKRIDVDNYKTWNCQKPIVERTVQGRVAMLTFSQPEEFNNSYGSESIVYRVQIKRPDLEEPFGKPDISRNPYHQININNVLEEANETAYHIFKEVKLSSETFYNGTYYVYDNGIKDYKIATVFNPSEKYFVIDNGYIIAGNTFTQTLPLKGQSKKDAQLTSYQYAIYAESINGFVSEPTYINVEALISDLRDFVQANKTEKSSYVEDLSAISANLGEISDGSLVGNVQNYWTLSDKKDKQIVGNNTDFHGAFRVGGDSQFLLIKPVVNPITMEVTDYEMIFHTKNIEFTSNLTKLNGQLTVYNDSVSIYDRTVITPLGTYYQHRDAVEYNPDGTEADNWYNIAKQETGGLLSKSILSTDSLIISNSTVTTRRRKGYDIGKPYLSDNSSVYHFDEDMADQNGNENYTFELLPKYRSYTPTLVGKEDSNGIDFTPAILAVSPYSEVGRSLFGIYSFNTVATTKNCTIDFWIKYFYAEGQVLFSVGTEQDKIQIVCVSGEPNYNEPQGDEPPYNYETEYPDMLTYNHAKSNTNDVYINHQGLSTSEIVRLETINETIQEGEWKHIGIVITETEIHCYIGETDVAFNRFSTAEEDIHIKIGDAEHSLILDELLIDTTVAESIESFRETTKNKIPWGKIDYRNKNTVLYAEEDENGPLFKTNIFESAAFKDAVKKIIAEEVRNG